MDQEYASQTVFRALHRGYEPIHVEDSDRELMQALILVLDILDHVGAPVLAIPLLGIHVLGKAQNVPGWMGPRPFDIGEPQLDLDAFRSLVTRRSTGRAA